jgi:hypothetical protein
MGGAEMVDRENRKGGVGSMGDVYDATEGERRYLV